MYPSWLLPGKTVTLGVQRRGEVDDGRMFGKSRPHFLQSSLRLVLLSAAILVKIVTMSVDTLSSIAGKQDLSSKCTRVTQATQAQGALDRYITSPLRLSATAWPANRSASVLVRCRSFCVDWPLSLTSLATLQGYFMIIGPSWRPEVTFSLVWPFRRSASAAEKFVAELSI